MTYTIKCPYAIAWTDLKRYSEGGNGEISPEARKTMRAMTTMAIIIGLILSFSRPRRSFGIFVPTGGMESCFFINFSLVSLVNLEDFVGVASISNTGGSIFEEGISDGAVFDN